ncbi:HK97 family phage prohead protease [Paenibacillus taichungensis]|uniref:HK97 family phage prohead protease n=1 Tax=Paenibacillus taichungensis TaxID=484184 RepID=UPI002DBBC7A8|nr:HK97 family phage prohead protease [Paenibacillus taichungensis]MEC0107262.1 HK97 family phage prohead protease [Paenibacillus taichungensis]MEC0194806.1 HK97 family phage prohead protease [Paenibacillus taichungensis]
MSKGILPELIREKRSFAFPDMRADIVEAEGGVIEGHAAVFDQRTVIGGMYEEVIERTAFARTDFRDVVMTVNHNLQSIPLARSRNNNANSTLQLSVDNVGLFMRGTLDIENNNEARALHSSVARKDIDGMSFIFFIRDQKWENLDSDMPIRRILDIARVVEVSAVSFPAYVGTDIDVAARDQQALESARSVLESARSGLVSSNNELEILRIRNQILAKG